MKLIIGGAYQGKRDYAAQNFPGMRVVADFHLAVLDMLKAGQDPLAQVERDLASYKDAVVISDDISCGVVPVDALERQWREAMGRVLGLIASQSDEVVRVFCGIGTRIK